MSRGRDYKKGTFILAPSQVVERQVQVKGRKSALGVTSMYFGHFRLLSLFSSIALSLEQPGNKSLPVFQLASLK